MCVRWQSPQASYGEQWDGGSPVPITQTSSESSSFTHSRGLRDGVGGRTLSSAEHHRLGVNVQITRLSICDKDAWDGR